MNFQEFMISLFQDENKVISMKRLCGLLCTVTLCIAMYKSSFTAATVNPPDSLIQAVALLAFGCLGLASADKIFAKKSDPPTDPIK